MNELITEDTKAILLLCGIFGQKRTEKPLAQNEYNKVVRWLVEARLRPADLLDPATVQQAAEGTGLDALRMKALLERGVALGFAVEEWQCSGLWVLSRSDADYPSRYKKHLKEKAPPLLFGAGARSLLRGGGIAIVGSRNVDASGEQFARQVATQCAEQNMPVVSGGARGVDQFAMSSAHEAGGSVIGVLADSLLRKSVERSARYALAEGKLLLLSPNHPEAGFNIGTAMGRNKLIYAMADYGLVVSTDYNKGGTWAGAKEELVRKSSRPVFVRVTADAPEANRKLLELGAKPWPEQAELLNLKETLEALAGSVLPKAGFKESVQGFFSFEENGDLQQTDSQYYVKEPVESSEKKETTGADVSPKKKGTERPGIYEAVLPLILEQLDHPVKPEVLAQTLEINKTQLNAWLKRALDEKQIRKLNGPVRYLRTKKPATQ